MPLKVLIPKTKNTLLSGFLTLASLATIASPGLSTKAFAQTPTDRNIIFISVGDLRNWLGFNGKYDGTVKAPNIDDLATE